ncbi:MAG: hypothetical protein WC483_00625 [Candidatus Paceibacterota bacterium]
MASFTHVNTFEDGKKSSVSVTASLVLAWGNFLRSNAAIQTEMIDLLHNARIIHKDDLRAMIVQSQFVTTTATTTTTTTAATATTTSSPSTTATPAPKKGRKKAEAKDAATPAAAKAEETWCEGKTKEGNPCKYHAKAGTKFCGVHTPAPAPQ